MIIAHFKGFVKNLAKKILSRANRTNPADFLEKFAFYVEFVYIHLKKMWYYIIIYAEKAQSSGGMTNMNIYVLYNPLAGTGNPTCKTSALTCSQEDEIIHRDITTLTARADYEAFLAELSPEDVIVLCGGDGTINRFVNATEGLDVPQDIRYIPGGTGNDFLKDLGLTEADAPISIKEYISNLPMAEVQGNTYRFLNNVGFGIDGYCCEEGDAQKAANEGKENPKPVNYTAIAIKGLLFYFKPCRATVTVDGVEHTFKKVWIAPTMKGRFYGGGMMPTPAQDRKDPDGKVSLMLFHGSGKLRTLLIFPSLFKGEHIKHKKNITIFEGKDIHVVFDRPCALQIDGETFLGVTEYRVRA